MCDRVKLYSRISVACVAAHGGLTTPVFDGTISFQSLIVDCGCIVGRLCLHSCLLPKMMGLMHV